MIQIKYSTDEMILAESKIKQSIKQCDRTTNSIVVLLSCTILIGSSVPQRKVGLMKRG
jgi:hypothetical protein